MEFTAIALLDEQNNPCSNFRLGETVRVCTILRANEEIEYIGAGVRLYDRMSNLIFACGNRQLGIHLPRLEQGTEILICFQLTLSVNPADYTLTVDCSEPNDEGPNQGAFQDVIEGLGPISVHFDLQDMWPFYGMAQLPLKVSFETVPTDTEHPASPPDPADDLETAEKPSPPGESEGRHHAYE